MLLIFLYILASTEAYGTLETRVYDTYDMYSQGYVGYPQGYQGYSQGYEGYSQGYEGGKLIN